MSCLLPTSAAAAAVAAANTNHCGLHPRRCMSRGADGDRNPIISGRDALPSIRNQEPVIMAAIYIQRSNTEDSSRDTCQRRVCLVNVDGLLVGYPVLVTSETDLGFC